VGHKNVHRAVLCPTLPLYADIPAGLARNATVHYYVSIREIHTTVCLLAYLLVVVLTHVYFSSKIHNSNILKLQQIRLIKFYFQNNKNYTAKPQNAKTNSPKMIKLLLLNAITTF